MSRCRYCDGSLDSDHGPHGECPPGAIAPFKPRPKEPRYVRCTTCSGAGMIEFFIDRTLVGNPVPASTRIACKDCDGKGQRRI